MLELLGIENVGKTTSILQIIGILLDIAGVLLILYSDGKIINLKPGSVADKIGPIIVKDYKIDPSTVFNERHGYKHNAKMKAIKTTGIVLIIIGAILLISGLLLVIAYG